VDRDAPARPASLPGAGRRARLEAEFARGEELRTEISTKFTRRRLEADYAASGLELAEWFTDDRGCFALSLASIV
jgi:L-histidine Nalpha-methyltransferase